MSYRKLVLAFTAAALTFMAGPAYSLFGSGLLSGRGSFSYHCVQNNPVGANYTFDAVANTFSADVGTMTCIFTLDSGGTVTVPMDLAVTYNNANVETTGSTTTVTATCPAATATGTFEQVGACVPGTGSCTDFSAELPDGHFIFQNPWVGAPNGQIDRICANNFPANELAEDIMASWSVTPTDATDPVFRFCATPTEEPCTEIQGSGRDRHLYVRGAEGTGTITLIADAQVLNTWNLTNPQQGNLNVELSPNAEVDPLNLTDIRVEGVLNSSCDVDGANLKCHFPSSELAPLVQNRIVNGQVALTGTAETVGGTAVIFFMIANISGNG